MINRITLWKVHYMPKELEPGILYVSDEFETAAHLCACGCGNKVVTPLGPTDWSLTLKKRKPSLSPSIGNWQIPCRSHYWIRDGSIKWSYQLTEKQILTGRKNEEKRREAYYSNLKQKKKSNHSLLMRLVNWLFKEKKV
jgi:hypothetical protein